jgi:phospholipid-binding lipoprotein MlaA
MMKPWLILVAAVAVGGCATTGDRAGLERDPRDPMEGFNRNVWAFNQAVDQAAIKPVTTVYRTVTPIPARRGISRVMDNLREPLSFINNLLQGKPGRAVNSLGRFLINTTIGVGGLADHATDLGLPETREDFGQTLAAWGFKSSPYLVLPLLGPSTVRDGIGTAATFAADPAQIGLKEAGVSSDVRTGMTVLRVIDARSRVIDLGVDAALEAAADPYAAARNAYFQRREAELQDVASGNLSREDEDRLLDEALDGTPSEPLADDPATPQQPEASTAPSAAQEEPEADPGVEPESPQLSLVLPEDLEIAY